MQIKFINIIVILALGFILQSSISCTHYTDTFHQLSLVKKNYVHYVHPTDPLYGRLTGSYYKQKDQLFVVLRWKYKTMVGTLNDFILLHLQEYLHLDGTSIKYELRKGISLVIVGNFPFEPYREIISIRTLKPEYFRAKANRNGRLTFVAYNGRVYALFKDGTTKAFNGIRFEVHPTENTKKVKSNIQALRPHLEKEGYTRISHMKSCKRVKI